MSYISLKNVCKRYKMGELTITASNNVSFNIDKGEFVCIIGASGAGKTTILNMLGGMDICDSGEIIVDGKNVAAFNKRQLTAYRRYDIGFVFQFYNLVGNLTALENVELASQICSNSMNAHDALSAVGLSERMNNFPSQLSGGEQQRVSIARAIAKKPKLLLCDEPTGALDYNTGKAILKLLYDCCKKHDMTVCIITHNSAIAPMADKVITIRNSAVESVIINNNPIPSDDICW